MSIAWVTAAAGIASAGVSAYSAYSQGQQAEDARKRISDSSGMT